MWSHYAKSHTGINIGITISDQNIVEANSVNYIDTLPTIQRGTKAVDVLMKKLKAWDYEEEYRVITSKEFVKVEVKEIILGAKCFSRHKKLIRDLIQKINPTINIIENS